MQPKITHMKSRIAFIIAAALLIVAYSCKKDNHINPDSNLKLEFSTDTILFDTVFTSLGSATHHLMVYNRHSDPLKISSVRLARGESSPFRLNLDGEAVTELYDKVIPATDSLYGFLRVTIDPTDANTPFVVEDELEFVTNGNTQTIKLMAWGQNAHYIVADKVITLGDTPYKYTIVADSLETTVWTNELPYVIYGYALINSYGTLRIEEGTRVYCHQGSGIFSWSDGQLIIDGSEANPVVIQGDRLEANYKDLPGQWEQIILMDGRSGADHRISHAIIKNALIGVNCQSSLKVTECSMHIDNTIIENHSSYGLFSLIYPIDVKNSVIANCGYSTFFALGGSYRFVHCTLDNHWHASTTARKTGSIQVGNYQMDNEYNVYYYPFNMEMNNCIITGSLENEFVTGFDGGADSTFIFNNCLLKSNRFTHSTSGFSHCIFNEEPLFVDVNRNNFHIDSIASPVIGTGNPLYGNEIPYDLDGVSRIGIPDMGAYQYVPKN